MMTKRKWRTVGACVLVYGIVVGVLDFVWVQARKNATRLTKLVYEQEMARREVDRSRFDATAWSRRSEHIAAAGPLARYEIVECISQLSGRPAICTVSTMRENGRSIERLYWYGDECLQFKVDRGAKR